MSLTLQELAATLELEFRGDGETPIHGVRSTGSARSGDLCFVLGEKQLASVTDSLCSAIVLKPELADLAGDKALLLSSHPHYSFIEAIRALALEPPALPAGVHPSAQVADTAQIGYGVRIGANAVIEDGVSIGADSIIGAGCVIEHSARIGRHCRLHSNVTLAYGVRLGDRCILQSGVVLGGDGYGLIMHEDVWVKVPQLGSVVVEDDVEIGANTTIDRGALDDTVIETGVKIDNQVLIAHNCRIGAHTAIAGCVGIAGSTTIGRYCKISGAANINGHITVADHTTISATAMVTNSIREAGVYSSGIPAMENSLWLRLSARYKALDKLARSVSRLEKLADKDAADNP